jgi:hypothetical protein
MIHGRAVSALHFAMGRSHRGESWAFYEDSVGGGVRAASATMSYIYLTLGTYYFLKIFTVLYLNPQTICPHTLQFSYPCNFVLSK